MKRVADGVVVGKTAKATKTVRRRNVAAGAQGWSRRLLGVVLCAFFGLGMATGLSAAGRALAGRVVDTALSYWHEAERALAMTSFQSGRLAPAGFAIAPGNAVALVERREGIYELMAAGELRGPVEPGSQDDLPILSGAAIETATADDLVDYAAVLVRAEAELSDLVSELRVHQDGTASLFLERARMQIDFDPASAATELARAAWVMRHWSGRAIGIASLDMTTAGQAVVRVSEVSPATPARRAHLRRVSDRAGVRVGGIAARSALR